MGMERTRPGGAGEIVPFCLLSVAGLVSSTLAVRYAGAHSVSFANPWRTCAVDGANLAAYAQVWVIQYFVLDRFLFTDKTGEPQGVVGHLPLIVSVAAGSSAATDWSANSGRSTLNTAPPPDTGDAVIVPPWAASPANPGPSSAISSHMVQQWVCDSR
jgi:hypothetical protein